MTVILAQVEGDSIAAKIDAIGIKSRQTYYYWRDGATRPSKKWAKRLAKLTGFSVDEIRGHAA